MPRARIAQAHRLHRPEAQRLLAPFRHHFDGQAALEIGRRFFPLLELGFLAGDQRRDEGAILRLVQRAIDVVRAVSRRTHLVIAGLEPGDGEIDRLAMHDGRDGVEEGERVFAGQRADRFGECRRRERPRCDDGGAPIFRRQAADLFAHDLDIGMLFERARDRRRETMAVDSQCASRRQFVRIGRPQHQRTCAAHLFVKQADGVVFPIVRTKRIGTDKFGEPVRLMRVGSPKRSHLMQHDVRTGLSRLPRGFAASQSAADDVNRCVHCFL